MIRISIAPAYVAMMTAIALAGCQSFDGEKVRRQHAQDYPQALAEKTAETIPPEATLGLDDCIRLALQNNLSVRSAEIQARIATLDRKIAFANFLPRLDLGYMHFEFDPAISIELADSDPMTIEKVRSLTWQANLSIFNPATWFLYAMHKRGAEIADLVTDYTRQMTALQVTMAYFQCLSLAETERALASEVAAAVEMEEKMRDLAGEGLIPSWQADQANVRVQARQVERERTRRSLRQAKANLLALLGLSPLAEITLRAEAPLEPPGGSLEDLVAEALLYHPELRIADRNVEIRKEQVKIALADFLPKLFGLLYRPEAIDEFGAGSIDWVYGLSGTMTIFNGFANINEYKAAKQRRVESFLQREQATLSVMLEVLRAYLTVTAAQEQVTLAQNAFEVATERFKEAEQQWREGLVGSSELLEVAAGRDRARAQAIGARFAYQVSTATLLNVMGKTRIDYEEPVDDSQS
ncbi:MAG: TolC family protein [Sedimentisphaerales bacterium]|nr:TolC family protein [Sedimentisphaerales bacterium]